MAGITATADTSELTIVVGTFATIANIATSVPAVVVGTFTTVIAITVAAST